MNANLIISSYDYVIVDMIAHYIFLVCILKLLVVYKPHCIKEGCSALDLLQSNCYIDLVDNVYSNKYFVISKIPFVEDLRNSSFNPEMRVQISWFDNDELLPHSFSSEIIDIYDLNAMKKYIRKCMVSVHEQYHLPEGFISRIKVDIMVPKLR